MQTATTQMIRDGYGAPLALAFVSVFVLLALGGILYDVRERRIPNALTLAIFAAGIIFSVLGNPLWPGLRNALAGAVVGFAVWIVFYAIGVMGAGDVKFFAALSSWLGPALAWRAALLCALIGGVLAVGFLLRDSRLRRTFRLFALLPFMRSLPTAQVVDLSVDEAKRQLPYGVALGSGSILAFLFPSILGLG